MSGAPGFDQSYWFVLREHIDDGSTDPVSLGTVSATDPDGEALTYSLVGGNDSGLFEIDTGSGELFYVGSGEDYETGSTEFDLTVRASDGSLHTDATVTVYVEDIFELNPAPPPPATAESVDYSADTSTTGTVAVDGTTTGLIAPYAGDLDWFAVELVAGRTYTIDLRGSPTDDGTLSDPLLYGIHDADGNRISGTRNDDGGEGYNSRLTFTATESGTHYIAAGAFGWNWGTYTVEVTDNSLPETLEQQVVQHAPAFGAQYYGAQLAENADGSSNRVSLGTVSATDPEGATLSYSLVRGNESGLFEIDAASGELFYTGGGEDYEAGSTQFELTVRASDGDQTADATVIVFVTDVNEAPTFGQQGYAFDLAENANGSTDRVSLGTVSATDPEGATLSYSLVGGNESGLFEIDEASGELFYTGGGEDYGSATTQFDLTVRASDGDQTTETTVTVNVTDVDEPVVVDPPVEQPPESAPQTVSEPAGEDFSTDTSTNGQVAVGDTATGNIGSSGDRDWFAVELVAGRTYTIDLRGSPTDDGTLRDPYLRGVHDAEGNLIPGTTNDDGGEGYNSRLTFTATESGTHYIAAGAYSGTGTYEVEVTDISDGDDVREGANDVGDVTDLQGPRFLRNSVDGDDDQVDYYEFTLTEAKEVGLGFRRRFRQGRGARPGGEPRGRAGREGLPRRPGLGCGRGREPGVPAAGGGDRRRRGRRQHRSRRHRPRRARVRRLDRRAEGRRLHDPPRRAVSAGDPAPGRDEGDAGVPGGRPPRRAGGGESGERHPGREVR